MNQATKPEYNGIIIATTVYLGTSILFEAQLQNLLWAGLLIAAGLQLVEVVTA